MKNNLKRLLALLMVLTLLFALAPAVFADEDEGEDETFGEYFDYENDDDFGFEDDDFGFEDDDFGFEDDDFGFGSGETGFGPLEPGGQSDDDHGKGLVVPVNVYFEYGDRPLKMIEGDWTTVFARVENAGDNASYSWYSDDSGVVRVEGSRDSAQLYALRPGHADITLAVNRDGVEGANSFHVDVAQDFSEVIVSGGSSITLEVGDDVDLRADVSGGSGSYSYSWDAFGEAALSVIDYQHANATVVAGRSGSGTVRLTVTDGEDPGNYGYTEWTFTVQDKPQTPPPEISIDRTAAELSVGDSDTLTVTATGGSGRYEYIWQSDNPSVVSVSGDSQTAQIRAASALIPGIGNSARITAFVRDTETGKVSNYATCVVTVSGGGTITYDVSDSTDAGQHYAMMNMARRISDYYAGSFGTPINYSANVMFESAGGAAGSIRLQDGTAVKANTGYPFAVFQDMVFAAAANGTFSTYYQIVDGGNTIYGIITLNVSGATGVTGASLSPTSLRMTTNSNQYLTLSVTPANASYTVEWTVADGRLLSVAGGGNKITLKSNSNTGTTTVTAIVTDANGARTSCSSTVTVYYDAPVDPTAYYDPSITVMLGSDYYGSKVADSIADRFRSTFGVYPADGATIIFPTLGKDLYGTMCTRTGASVVPKQNYTFRDFVDMYFIPTAAGTYSFQYQLNYRNNLMVGTVKVLIDSTSLSVNINPNALVMAPYSSQYVTLNISPATAYYRVSWASSDNRVATVSGSNTTAIVNSVGAGTATIYAIVTDNRGVEVRRGCTVVVTNSGSTFSPTVATTLGVPYVGTGASGAMRSQFQSVYGMTLADNAIIRFSSTGNNEVGVMRLADGSMIRPNTDYTLSQFVSMYTQPVAAGTYSVPYSLSYAGKSLNGTVNVTVNSASLSTDLNLPGRNPYWFSDPLMGSTGGSLFADSIRNAVGSGWSCIRFSKTSDSTGTLYLNRNYAALTQTTNLTPAMLSQLCFVPGTLTGTFSAPYTIYAANGGVLGTGTLNINTQGVTFSDVPANAYYAPAVSWAVGRGVTSGTGGTYFSPDMTVTRGQAVTFLWRAAGQPKSVLTINPFVDVVPGAYYYDAVLWAVQQGITSGTSDTTFSPDLPLHRDQLLTFLCRANGGYAGGADWSQLAVNWATNRGLLAGIPVAFVPAGDCPRSEVVYYLWKNFNG